MRQQKHAYQEQRHCEQCEVGRDRARHLLDECPCRNAVDEGEQRALDSSLAGRRQAMKNDELEDERGAKCDRQASQQSLAIG